MKPLYRNVFLAIGVVAIIIMLCTSDLSYSELWDNVRRAGYWFPAVILLWVFLYLANAWSWSVIIHDGAAPKVPFLKIYKYTISGYALNYVTPVGLLGGEPYRIMELTPYVGAAKATSSVILYAMMHIFSHFCFNLRKQIFVYTISTSQCLWVFTTFVKFFLLFSWNGSLLPRPKRWQRVSNMLYWYLSQDARSKLKQQFPILRELSLPASFIL